MPIKKPDLYTTIWKYCHELLGGMDTSRIALPEPVHKLDTGTDPNVSYREPGMFRLNAIPRADENMSTTDMGMIP